MGVKESGLVLVYYGGGYRLLKYKFVGQIAGADVLVGQSDTPPYKKVQAAEAKSLYLQLSEPRCFLPSWFLVISCFYFDTKMVKPCLLHKNHASPCLTEINRYSCVF